MRWDLTFLDAKKGIANGEAEIAIKGPIDGKKINETPPSSIIIIETTITAPITDDLRTFLSILSGDCISIFYPVVGISHFAAP